MKISQLFLFVIIFTVFSPFGAAQNQAEVAENTAEAGKELKDISHKLTLLEESVIEVRRDQLNYKIEKDLLKEVYSSNLQMLNLAITIVLGVFTVLGFFGMRSVRNTRKEFSDELNRMRDLRGESEKRLADIEIQQSNAKSELLKITESNSDQDAKIKLLEIQEGASSRTYHKQWIPALEYIAVGLSIDPDNEMLSHLQKTCLVQLGRFEEARIVMEKILELDSKNASMATDLCEVYLFISLRNQYASLREEFSYYIDERDSLGWYFDALVLFQDKDFEGLEEHVRSIAKMTPVIDNKYIFWDFTEFGFYIKEIEESEIKELLVNAINVISGQSDPKVILSKYFPAEDADKGGKQ